MKNLPERYFRTLRTFTLKRPHHVLYFNSLRDSLKEYGSCPTAESIGIQIEKLDGISEEEFKQLGEVCSSIFGGPKPDTSLEFLVDETENWCKERAVYLAIMEAISIHDGQGDQPRDSIPGLLSEALSVSFDSHVGHDYLNDYQERV